MDYELIEDNDPWDCDPQAPIVMALLKAIAARKAKEPEWKGPSWHDGHQDQPLLD
jgi:hypothetical protein